MVDLSNSLKSSGVNKDDFYTSGLLTRRRNGQSATTSPAEKTNINKRKNKNGCRGSTLEVSENDENKKGKRR